MEKYFARTSARDSLLILSLSKGQTPAHEGLGDIVNEGGKGDTRFLGNPIPQAQIGC